MDSESLKSYWYVICNPSSGGGIKQKKIDQISISLKNNKIPHKFIKTSFAHHEEELVQKAIYQGYIQFICIGGDGTVHHIINGIMKQKFIDSKKLKLAVIPCGTGNDWVKNYKIPKDPEQAIRLIKNNKLVFQDIGKINLVNEQKEFFFNNAAGIGFDAYVVKNLHYFKKWGSLAYLLAALASFSSFQKTQLSYSIDSIDHESDVFMITLGICKYSGGGMRLTNYKNHKEEYLDLTLIKNISFLRVLCQILRLYNGKINKVKETQCSNIQNFKLDKNTEYYIQADGELIGKGKAIIHVKAKAIQLVIP